MGMFDYITCSAPLPGTTPTFVKPGHKFQTKDLDCLMETYEITADGRLLGSEMQEVKHYGCFTVDFYTSNASGGWGNITFTRQGEDFESADYTAMFVDGRLRGIHQTAYERKPALQQKNIGYQKPTADDVAEHRRAEQESLAGRRMYLRYGGSDAGADVEVVAEGPKEWVVRKTDDTFEVIDRRMRGSTFFASAAEADAQDASRQAEYDRQKAEYDAMLARRGGD